MVSKNDLDELKRIATNSYDGDKRFANRVIAEISNMNSEIAKLKAENQRLSEEHKVI